MKTLEILVVYRQSDDNINVISSFRDFYIFKFSTVKKYLKWTKYQRWRFEGLYKNA